MSIRTNDPWLRALAMIARTFSTHNRSSISSPIWVSFSDTFASAPTWRMRSSVSRYVSGEARAQPLGEALEFPDETARAEVIGVAERAAAERRKAEAEHGGDVAVAGARDDALSHRARRFVEHRQDEALDGLRRSRAAVRLRADEPVHGGVDVALLPPRVRIKPLPRLAAEPTGFRQSGERGRRREAVTEDRKSTRLNSS